MLLSDPTKVPTATKDQLERNINRMKSDIEKACQDTENEKLNSNVTKGLWPKVQEARRHWQVSFS